MGAKPRHTATFDQALAQFHAAPFDASLAALARNCDALPVYAQSDDVYIVRRDGTADIVGKQAPHASTMSNQLNDESQHRLEALAHACALHRFHVRSTALDRPATARTCWSCKGKRRVISQADYRYELDETTWLCGACVGRGWQRNLFAELADHALQQVFAKCWTVAGFNETLAAAPRDTLRANGVTVADDVPLSIEINRDKNWCWNCQLTIARVETTAGIVERLDELTANIRVRLSDDVSPFLTLVVGQDRHICTCAEPDPYPFVVHA